VEDDEISGRPGSQRSDENVEKGGICCIQIEGLLYEIAKLWAGKGRNFGQKIEFSTMTMFQLTRRSPSRIFLAKISITEMEHPPHSSTNDFWSFLK
jgi:hypothetical protein